MLSKVLEGSHLVVCGRDAYCFELLSMVLALSGSAVGRAYLAMQHSLITDLLSLLHTASPRVQRQVTSVLRRVLPEVAPETLASLIGVRKLPDADRLTRSTSSVAGDDGEGETFDPKRVGILDVFLACIAKSLSLQVKSKGKSSGRGVTSTCRVNTCVFDK